MSCEFEEQRYVIIKQVTGAHLMKHGKPYYNAPSLELAMAKLRTLPMLDEYVYVWVGSNVPNPACACIGRKKSWASKPLIYAPWDEALTIFESHLRMMPCPSP